MRNKIKDWQTYIGLGFSVKYPVDWEFHESEPFAKEPLDTGRVYISPPSPPAPVNYIGFMVIRYKNPDNYSISEWWGENKMENKIIYDKKEDTSFLGVSSLRTEATKNVQVPSFSYFLPHGFYVYRISINLIQAPDREEIRTYNKIAEKVLQTFQFTD